MNDDKIRYLSHQWVSNLHGKEFNSTSEEMSFQSYAYQDGYKAGADWMQERMIEKVAEWMRNLKDGQGNFPLYDYVGNFKQAMQDESKCWIKIDRDKDGFLSDKSRDEIYNSLPVIVWYAEGGYAEGAICKDNYYDWLSDLNKVCYTHWMPIVPPKRD